MSYRISFDQTTKVYGTIFALKEVSFIVEPGEFVFICGPSGAGKSTLIKLLLNQLKPTTGSVAIDSVDLSTASTAQIDNFRRQTGVVFQDFQLIPDKNISENIALALDIVDCPQSEIPARIDEVLSQVKLTNRQYLYPSQLSGGELQRASLARAIAIKPQLILADEPTGNLDDINSWNLIKLFNQLNEKLRSTIIMTTHNQDIVRTLDKRVITLEGGVVIDKSTSTPILIKKTKKKKVTKKIKK